MRFQVRKIKVRNLGVMHKIRLRGDHQTFTFSVMQLVDMMKPGGAKVNISFFWINGPLIQIL